MKTALFVISSLLITSLLIFSQEKINGWELSGEKFDQAVLSELKQKIADSTFKNITSIIVIKNGKLFIEEYFNGFSRASLHDTRSVSKTFASAITGIALNEGYLNSINQKLSEFYDLNKYDNYSDSKSEVTIKNLLTMSSAFLGSDNDESSPGNEENMYPQPDWVKWTLNLPMDTAKANGKQWDYFTAGVVVLGDILNSRVKGGLEKYAHEKLFAPLGIEKYQWQYTPQSVPNTAGGLQFSSLDLAKFGWLYKNKGVWNGIQIISVSWAEESLTKHMILPFDDMAYGYLWWNKKYSYQNTVYETFACSGNGGNKIFVFTELPLVVVITSTAYNKNYAHSQANKIIEQYILPGVLK